MDVQHDRAIVRLIGQGHLALSKSITRYRTLIEAAEVLPLWAAN